MARFFSLEHSTWEHLSVWTGWVRAPSPVSIWIRLCPRDPHIWPDGFSWYQTHLSVLVFQVRSVAASIYLLSQQETIPLSYFCIFCISVSNSTVNSVQWDNPNCLTPNCAVFLEKVFQCRIGTLEDLIFPFYLGASAFFKNNDPKKPKEEKLKL